MNKEIREKANEIYRFVKRNTRNVYQNRSQNFRKPDSPQPAHAFNPST